MRHHYRRNTEMKYLRILSVLAAAMFCGSLTAHAQGFHAQVLDPSCNLTSTECGVGFTDIGVPFSVALSAGQCTSDAIMPPITGLPTDGTPFGCFLGNNDTGVSITSITLDFASIAGVTSCDTLLPGDVTPGPAFSLNTCNVDSAGGFDLSFSGGPGVADGHQFVILEEGVDPSKFVGMVNVASTPEPDSLLLFSTGAMMMAAGLFLSNRRRFAFLKK
jgi:hypothetical protein